MPRLLLFAPCEKVIIGLVDNSLSLISVMTELHVAIPHDVPSNPPATVMGYGSWSVLTLWEQLASEGDSSSFEQRITLADPFGVGCIETVTPFQMTKQEHRIFGTIPGFPVSPAGTYTLRLYLRPSGQNEWGAEIASFPMRLVHEPGAANAAPNQECQTESQPQ
jgi:hypothetical protein